MKYLFLLFMSIPSVVYAQPYGDHMTGWHMFGWGYGGLFMWFLFILIIGLIFYVLTKTTSSKPSESYAEGGLKVRRLAVE